MPLHTSNYSGVVLMKLKKKLSYHIWIQHNCIICSVQDTASHNRCNTKKVSISYHWWSRGSRGWLIFWSRCNDDRKINYCGTLWQWSRWHWCKYSRSRKQYIARTKKSMQNANAAKRTRFLLGEKKISDKLSFLRKACRLSFLRKACHGRLGAILWSTIISKHKDN